MCASELSSYIDNRSIEFYRRLRLYDYYIRIIFSNCMLISKVQGNSFCFCSFFISHSRWKLKPKMMVSKIIRIVHDFYINIFQQNLDVLIIIVQFDSILRALVGVAWWCFGWIQITFFLFWPGWGRNHWPWWNKTSHGSF